MIFKILLLTSFLISQSNMVFNFESKYGNGTNINDLNLQEVNYSYFENLLDINYNYKNIFFYTQLEYSNSPIYGIDRYKINSLPNTYYIELSDSQYLFKFGHIQTLYGYGLATNMFQDHNTDFDNRVKGAELKYMPLDEVELFAISGTGNYGIKSRADARYNALNFKYDYDLFGVQYFTEIGDFLASFGTNKTKFKAGILNDYSINQPFLSSDTRLSVELQEFQLDTGFSEFSSIANEDTFVELNSLNIGYSNTLSIFDIYYEKSINTYNKILRKAQNQNGYNEYLSLSTNLFGFDILYEFKDYNMPYYFPITSNPPTVFMESSSVLLSRNLHAINFSDEIGHQFEARVDLNDISFIFNISMGMKHYGIQYTEFSQDNGLVNGTYSKVNWNDVLKMNFLNEDLVAHKPFRDYYAEMNGWSRNNSLYYKFGLSSQYSYDNVSAKNYQTITIPTQFVYRLKNNNSVTIYYENQKIDNLNSSVDWESYYIRQKYSNEYLSLSYNINKFASFTYFLDKEIKSFYDANSEEMPGRKNNKWTGYEINFELSSSAQLSIFQGSQKGGLVCANGICAVQPSFEDGIKVTYRTIF